MRTMPLVICSCGSVNIEDGYDCYPVCGSCTLPHMAGKQSEFNAEVQKNGVFPPPHVPTPSEELGLVYRTGDPTGNTPPDPDAFKDSRVEWTQ